MTETTGRTGTRTRIVEAAARLLGEQGTEAVTTRRVAEAAGVQAPAIYRLFGDKDGLLDAVAEHVMATYVAVKAVVVETAATEATDPMQDLRAGWESHVEFGLANPALFAMLNDPSRGPGSPAVQAGRRVLESRIQRVAATGRLRVSERRAVELVHAAGTGAVLALLQTPAGQRDLGLADAMYDAVVAQLTTGAAPLADDGVLTAAVALRAVVPRLTALSEAERRLAVEWLDRVVEQRPQPSRPW